MVIKVYGSSCRSTRVSKKWFESQGIPYKYKDITANPLSVEEVQHILKLTEHGTEDIISKRSNAYKNLTVNLDEWSLSELYQYIQEDPKLLRHPIICNENKLQVGFDKYNIRQFIPRKERQSLLNSLFLGNPQPQVKG